MTDTINTWLAAFEGFFEYGHAVAVVLGLCVALIVAQAVKIPLSLYMFDAPPLDDSERVVLFRWVVRVCGGVAGMIATAILWPPNGTPSLPWVAGIVVAGVAHPAYKLVVLLMSKRLPWLSVTKP